MAETIKTTKNINGFKGIGYATYDNESGYTSPVEMSPKSRELIQRRQARLGGIALSILNA